MTSELTLPSHICECGHHSKHHSKHHTGEACRGRCTAPKCKCRRFRTSRENSKARRVALGRFAPYLMYLPESFYHLTIVKENEPANDVLLHFKLSDAVALLKLLRNSIFQGQEINSIRTFLRIHDHLEGLLLEQGWKEVDTEDDQEEDYEEEEN